MEESVKKNKKLNINLPVLIFIITAIVFAIPSITYLMKNKTIYGFYYVWTYLFNNPATKSEMLNNALMFFLLMTILFLAYILIAKKWKTMSKKSIVVLVILTSIIFGVIIPYTSTDVYSYIGNGWAAAHYGENPYYTATGEITDRTGQIDPMLNKVANCWKYETVVYGPLWTLICTGLSYISFGNIDIALMIFKLANILVHILNTILVYKITRKKLFMIIYGLNPFILFEAISNVHNDIFIILFILLAIYFTIRRKNLFIAVACVAFATAVKYLAILILPFIVLYYVKNKDVKKRIIYCILCGIEYIVIIALFYLIYMRDFSVLAGLFIQQSKYNRSIMYVIYEYFGQNAVEIIQTIALAIFAVIYVAFCIRLLLQKKISFMQIIRKYNIFLLAFTFILITNFNAWYIMWLIPTMFFLKRGSQETILALSYTSQIANFASFALHSEEQILGIPFLIIMLVGMLLIKAMNMRIQRTDDGKIKVIR